MTAIKSYQYTGVALVEQIAYVSCDSGGPFGTDYRSASKDVRLPDGYIWLSCSVRATRHAGSCGYGVTAYFKDGSYKVIAQGNTNGIQASIPLSNVLTTAQIADIDYIRISCWASGGDSSDSGSSACGSAGVNALKSPWQAV